jgi:mono/diheme cytochrome c family protein
MPATVTNETKNPYTDLAAAAQKGKPVYEANCSYCHGVTGASDGPFQPKPPVINSGAATKASDGELFLVVRNGKGKSMPPMKRMTDEEIWQAVAYVRTLEKK